MSIRVVTPPSPIVTPADIPGSHAANDPTVTALIAAVTEEIDGPGGWLGRALGKQTLELALPEFCGRNLGLPCPPVIAATVTLKYLDTAGVEQTIEDTHYKVFENRIWLDFKYRFPAVQYAPDAVRIRYDAGYGDGSGNGPIPERARQAIILSVKDLMRVGSSNPGLRSETVEGIGSKTFIDSDRLTDTVNKTCERLLSTLQVFGA